MPAACLQQQARTADLLMERPHGVSRQEPIGAAVDDDNRHGHIADLCERIELVPREESDPGATKNREARVFPLTAELRSLLKKQRTTHDRLKKAGTIVPQVFFRMVAEGRGGPKKPRAIVSLMKAWKVACRAAGCPGRIPHDLRRTAIRAMVRRGIPERVAMTLTGHKTRSVFERYNIVSGIDLRDAARRLESKAQ